jgi:hypothetical protein
MAEAQQVTQALRPVDGQEQAGVVGGEQGRIATVEPVPRKRERLRQPGCEVGCPLEAVRGREAQVRPKDGSNAA